MPTIGCPEWTEYRKKNGFDPLGMQNTSVALYQRLLPGISNVTLRMRYYGLYAWLSAVYARRVGDTDLKTCQRFVRRAEALYALAAQARGGEGGIAGIQWAQRKLAAANGDGILFAEDAEPGSPTYYLKRRGVHSAQPIRASFSRLASFPMSLRTRFPCRARISGKNWRHASRAPAAL
jgi:hypothetical protein